MLIFSMSFYVLNAVQTREISVTHKSSESTQVEESNKTESAVNSNAQSDYDSDIDSEYEETVKSLRSVRSKIILGTIAVSFLGLLVLIIVLVHFKSRKVSQLMSLI